MRYGKQETDDNLTMTGDLLGTLRYMSPEQSLAKRIIIDHRTDVYSLGITLYEFLTLQPAFPGNDRQELLRQIAFEEPSAPRKLKRSIPAELETIVLKAMSKNPSERYQTAQEFAEDLGRYLDDEPIRAKRPGALLRVRKWARRHQSLVTTVIAAVLVLLVFTAVGMAVNSALVAEQRNIAQKGWDEAEAITLQAKHRLYEARLAQARAGRHSRQIGQRFESFKALQEATPLARELKLDDSVWMDLRNEAIACLALFDVRLDHEWEGLHSRDASMAFDSDLTHYATCDTRGNITVRRVADDQELVRFVALKKTEHRIKFSLDGKLLATYALSTSTTDVLVWDWRKESTLFRSPFSDSIGYANAFSADSKRFAVARMNGSFVVFDIFSRKEITQIETKIQPHNVAFSPDDSKLAVGSLHGGRQELQVWKRATAKLLRKRSFGTFDVA